MRGSGLRWWETRGYAAALVLVSIIPLLYPPIPPITDLLGHMGRYRIELDLATSPFLHQWFDFRWALLGNLGVDLLILPLAPLFGLEFAVKLIVIGIVAMTVSGMLLIAREAHGRLPPTAAFALPLAYGYPFQYGFVNFALSMAMALLAFAFWLRLGRLGKLRLRAILFVPISAAIWLAHTYGWGMLGLIAFAAEVVRRHRGGDRWFAALWHGGLACLPLTPPIVLMILWRSESVAGGTNDWFYWYNKYRAVRAILRDRWEWFDVGSILLLGAVFLAALLRRRPRLDPILMLAALILALTFALLPRILLGSAYADMRLGEYVVAFAILAISAPKIGPRLGSAIAIGALAFFLVRTAGTTASFVILSRGHQAQLRALDHVPRGARIYAMAHLPCQIKWDAARMDHVSAIGIVRREAFVNGQWVMPGAQLLTVHFPAPGFSTDPSQITRPPHCRPRGIFTWDYALTHFPRDRFDYLWLIDAPRDRWPEGEPDLERVWNGRTGALYRIGSATSPSETPNGSERPATQ